MSMGLPVLNCELVAENMVCRCHVFDWRAKCGAAGLQQAALDLLRPDTYVALADAAGSVDAIERYFAERGIQFSRIELPKAQSQTLWTGRPFASEIAARRPAERVAAFRAPHPQPASLVSATSGHCRLVTRSRAD